jgi:outer membrane protein assembly factor BamB
MKQMFRTKVLNRPTLRRRSAIVATILVAAAAAVAIGCSGPPRPRGWAPASPIVLEDQDIVLVPHRGKVTALAPLGVTGNFTQWQFPPRERDLYPVSTFAGDRIKDAIEATSIESTAKRELGVRVDDLRVSGDTGNALKNAIDATTMSDQEKSDIKDLVDEIREFESSAVRNLRAIYGDIGVSEDGDTAYVGAFRGIIYALDTRTGASRWMRDTSGELVGGIAVDGDTIYAGTKENRLFAARASDGELIWSIRTSGEVWSTPVIDGDALYATSLGGAVYKLDKKTGDEIWKFDDVTSGIGGAVTVEDGSVYIGAFDSRLYALDAEDGSVRWTLKADNWFWARAVVEDGVVYASALDGKVYAVRADDGSPAWATPFDTGAPIRSTPALGGGGLLVISRDAQLHKLDLATGADLEASPVTVGESNTVESDLALDADNLLFVVPRSASLWIFDVTDGLRSLGEFPLPN